jgi:hypothetical protein
MWRCAAALSIANFLQAPSRQQDVYTCPSYHQILSGRGVHSVEICKIIQLRKWSSLGYHIVDRWGHCQVPPYDSHPVSCHHMSYYLFLLPITDWVAASTLAAVVSLLALPYVYRELLEPASIDRALMSDLSVRHILIYSTETPQHSKYASHRSLLPLAFWMFKDYAGNK